MTSFYLAGCMMLAEDDNDGKKGVVLIYRELPAPQLIAVQHLVCGRLCVMKA
jgi:hypothetical protein